jgi:hypothetical protein
VTGYTYEQLLQDMRQAALLLTAINEGTGYQHERWSPELLEYEISFLTRNVSDLSEEVE